MSDKCTYCGVDLHSKHGHAFFCTEVDDGRKLRKFEQLSDSYLSAFRRADKRLKDIILWQGKYSIVKTENNSIRKQIQSLQQQLKEERNKVIDECIEKVSGRLEVHAELMGINGHPDVYQVFDLAKRQIIDNLNKLRKE